MPKTYNDIYFAVRSRLRDNGVEAFGLEARILLAAAAGKTTEQLMCDMYLYTSSEIEEKAMSMLERRLAGVLRAPDNGHSGCSHPPYGHRDHGRRRR